jgi:tRNA-splicing ligase RtcB (3'-phosphate/5'-hydroxy nucleic acid ligase)
MDMTPLIRESEFRWRLDPTGFMRVPVILYGTRELVAAMDDKVLQQAVHVATLPGIRKASFTLPDAHWGYGFPVGGVAAFDAAEQGIVSACGVGFDISCGLRTMVTGLKRRDIDPHKRPLADALQQAIPAGVGSTGTTHLDRCEMNEMLFGGARWAVARGFGVEADLDRIEDNGRVEGADPCCVPERAKERQRDEMGSLGSGNHYLEIQEVTRINDTTAANSFGIGVGDLLVTLHCGSRGLGHQTGVEFMHDMILHGADHGIELPDRELACAPIDSPLGQRYLGAMRAAANCALANRQILTHLARGVFGRLFPGTTLDLLYDVSHNTCRVEDHVVDGALRRLHVHRKGATRALGPGHPELPECFRPVGQPVLVGGSMGTCSYILAGNPTSEHEAFGSAVHGAGRLMSRHQALKQHSGRRISDQLATRGILVRSPSTRGIAEEAPAAYKDVTAVVNAAEQAGLARKVARLEPLVCVKG